MLSTFFAALTEISAGTYYGFGNFLIQSGNLIVIIVMLVLFVLALVLPFPGTRRSK